MMCLIEIKETNNGCLLMKFECMILLNEEALRCGKGDIDLTSWAMVGCLTHMMADCRMENAS